MEKVGKKEKEKSQFKIIIQKLFESKEDAQNIYKALQSEIAFKRRADSSINLIGKKLIINISANDISALHATVNSYMRALKVSLAVISINK